MSDYSEAERRLIESRNQTATNQVAVPFSVDQPTTPRIDKKPEAKDVDLKGMVAKVNEASKEQQANAPTVFDTIDKDMPWLKWVTGTLGVLGAAYGVNKLFGGGDDNTPPPPPPPPGGPNNRSRSTKDRSFTRTEPTFNSAETTQASMTAGEPKFVADPIPVAPKPVTDVVTVPGTPDTTASVIPTTDQPKVVPVPSNAPTQIKYGETNYNVPMASPNVAVAPPAEIAPAPVQPKPIDPVQQAKIDKINAEIALINQRASQEAERHANTLANDAQRAEASTQKKQGQVKSNLSQTDQAILADNNEAKARATLVESGLPKPSTASPVGGTSLPVGGTAGLPQGEPPVKAVAEPVKGTNVAVASMLPPETPPASSVVPTSVDKTNPVAPSPEKVAAATKSKLPGTESWLQGTWGAKNNPQRAANLVENLKATLPEGEKLSFPVGADGKSLGGMPSRDHVMKFTNDLLGTSMDAKAFKEFRFTEENLTKMQDSLIEKIKNAPSPEAAAKLQKGFATLTAMAATAGVALSGLALYEAYKKAKAGEYGEAAKVGIPAAAGLVSPAAGGLSEAVVNPSGAAQQLRNVAPILGTFADVANQKVQQFLKKPKGAIQPPK